MFLCKCTFWVLFIKSHFLESISLFILQNNYLLNHSCLLIKLNVFFLGGGTQQKKEHFDHLKTLFLHYLLSFCYLSPSLSWKWATNWGVMSCLAPQSLSCTSKGCWDKVMAPNPCSVSRVSIQRALRWRGWKDKCCHLRLRGASLLCCCASSILPLVWYGGMFYCCLAVPIKLIFKPLRRNRQRSPHPLLEQLQQQTCTPGCECNSKTLWPCFSAGHSPV